MFATPGYAPPPAVRNRRLSSARRAAVLLFAVVSIAAGGAGPSKAAPSPDTERLQLASVHAVIRDLDSGAKLVNKYAHSVVPIASVTKLMTAMVVLDSGEPLDEWLTVRERLEAPPNNGYSRIRTDSALQRGELLRIALMSSDNLAAYTLARRHPGGLGAFVVAMNAKARDLGMTDSTFAGPSGLSETNRSTAADLMKMVRAAMDYETIREYTRTGARTVRFSNPRYNLRYGNTNPLVRREDWDVALSKTGYLDAAGRCLVMIADIDDRTVAMVLLDSFGTLSPIGDAGRIRDWIETGSGGDVAGPALEYEQRKTAAYMASDGAG